MTQRKYDARYRHGIEDEQLQYFDMEVQQENPSVDALRIRACCTDNATSSHPTRLTRGVQILRE